MIRCPIPIANCETLSLPVFYTMSSSTSRVLSLAARQDGQSARQGRAGVVCRAAAKQAKGVVDDGYVYSACTERCDTPAPSSSCLAGGDEEALHDVCC